MGLLALVFQLVICNYHRMEPASQSYSDFLPNICLLQFLCRLEMGTAAVVDGLSSATAVGSITADEEELGTAC